MKKVAIRTQIVQGISSRVHQIIEGEETISECIKKKGKEYFVEEVFGEKTILLGNLYKEYNSFIQKGKSELFAWMYIINSKFGLVIDEHIHLYYFDEDMVEIENTIFPWMYVESKKYIGDAWWFDDDEIISDIQRLSLIDFLEKYKGY